RLPRWGHSAREAWVPLRRRPRRPQGQGREGALRGEGTDRWGQVARPRRGTREGKASDEIPLRGRRRPALSGGGARNADLRDRKGSRSVHRIVRAHQVTRGAVVRALAFAIVLAGFSAATAGDEKFTSKEGQFAIQFPPNLQVQTKKQ